MGAHQLHNYGSETVPQPGLTAGAAMCARQDAGRLVGHQCHGLPARPARDYDGWAAQGASGWPGMTCCPTSSAARPTNAWARRCMAKTAPACQRSAQRQPFQQRWLEPPASAVTPSTPTSTARRRKASASTRPPSTWASAGAPRAYLRPHMGVRANLQVRCGVQVQRVLFDGRRAVGVECAGWLAAPTARPARGGAGGRGHPVAAVADACRAWDRPRTCRRWACPCCTTCPASAPTWVRPSGLRLRLRTDDLNTLGISLAGSAQFARRGALPPRATRLAGGQYRRGRRLPAHLACARHAQHPAAPAGGPGREPRAATALGPRHHLPRLRAAPQSRGSVRLASHGQATRRSSTRLSSTPTTCRSSSRGCKLTRKLMHAPRSRRTGRVSSGQRRPRPTTKSKP